MLVGVLIVPAIVMAVTYTPIATQLSRALVSPYPKADAGRRFLAAALDALPVVTLMVLFSRTGALLDLAAAAAYLLCRDAVAGQSVGKFFCSLVVIELETSRPCTIAGSLRRNVLLVLPGANLVAVFLEARTILRDPQGQRLGDRLAQTQVVEGLGARDLVKSFQNWLMGLGDAVGRAGRGRRAADRHRPWAARARRDGRGSRWYPYGTIDGAWPSILVTMPPLFSYGTLQHPAVQMSTFGRLLHGHPDELVGFEQAVFTVTDPEFVAKSGEADHAIVKFNGRPDSRVRGTVFEVTDAELALADQYEPEGYTRVTATLASGNQAWVYADAGSS